MGYDIFGKSKTIVLPVPGVQGMSLEEYKNKYGIDLKDFIRLDGTRITFNTNHSLILIDGSTYDGLLLVNGIENAIIPSTDSSLEDYVAGSSDARLTIGVYNVEEEIVCGISFYLSRNKEFSIDNIELFPAGV